MSNPDRIERVHTSIWLEEPEPHSGFAAKTAYCHGFDVYGEMLGRARWVEMLYLLFRGEAPSSVQADLFEALTVALANAGPRDHAVHAAMCAGVGGSPAASALMAALAVGAGQHTGAREVVLAMEAWEACGTDLPAWQRALQAPASASTSIWPAAEHPPGFDAHGVAMATIVKQSLECLARLSPGPRLRWLADTRSQLEEAAGCPLAMTGVAAAALADLGFTAEQGEMLHLLLRLPGAAAHALEQRAGGYKNFPFFALELQNDPSLEAAQ